MNANAVRAWAMVAVQGVLFLTVAVTAFLRDVGPALFTSLWLALALVLVGSAGVIASGRNLGRSLTPSPVPNEAGLAASGLYRYARHPMYTALVVICLGVAVGSGALLCYVSVVVLAVFFGFKARMEERYLRRVYNGYDAYAARTGRFLPGIGRRKG
ncbi:methyltransferase family protein [Demequina activiva]|uniref:Isoprenylcysteine carboxylmethyltransferase family protein n=1 Tax=Demequina activiva TaxID=1582364 RepID=A0A919Q1R2_9MICO|nr:isoprenylcysteine carboxylmethyltransferase family protein [Demequina activiva]GIG53301.1 hypothetical protein Dac01nite_00530 [Demequina activiva]